jgi:putative tricarboxylic transport membrane protein
MAGEEVRVQSILAALGTGTPAPAAGGSAIGRYPLFVLTGLAVATMAFIVSSGRRRFAVPGADTAEAIADTSDGAARRALLWIGAAIVVNVLLLERAGFILASIPLFWLTARAFDDRHPLRDAVFAVVLSTVAYVVFARVLQIGLPPGLLARWL